MAMERIFEFGSKQAYQGAADALEGVASQLRTLDPANQAGTAGVEQLQAKANDYLEQAKQWLDLRDYVLAEARKRGLTLPPIEAVPTIFADQFGTPEAPSQLYRAPSGRQTQVPAQPSLIVVPPIEPVAKPLEDKPTAEGNANKATAAPRGARKPERPMLSAKEPDRAKEQDAGPALAVLAQGYADVLAKTWAVANGDPKSFGERRRRKDFGEVQESIAYALAEINDDSTDYAYRSLIDIEKADRATNVSKQRIQIAEKLRGLQESVATRRLADQPVAALGFIVSAAREPEYSNLNMAAFIHGVIERRAPFPAVGLKSATPIPLVGTQDASVPAAAVVAGEAVREGMLDAREEADKVEQAMGKEVHDSFVLTQAGVYHLAHFMAVNGGIMNQVLPRYSGNDVKQCTDIATRLRTKDASVAEDPNARGEVVKVLTAFVQNPSAVLEAQPSDDAQELIMKLADLKTLEQLAMVVKEFEGDRNL